MADFFEDKFENKYVDVNGLRLHYTDWGGNSSKPLLMVHGFNVQLHTWDPIADMLRDEYHVYCLDLRGHGDSDWANCGRGAQAIDGYPLQAFVSDIYEFQKKLNLAPFDYVGHSLGSRIGIGYAGAHPETLKHVALSDTGPEVSRAGAEAVRDRAAGAGTASAPPTPRGFRTEEEVRDFYAQQHQSWRPIFIDLHARYQVRKNWADRLIFKADPDMFWITGSFSLREVPHLWDMASKITVPALVMWGETSNLLNEEIANRMIEVMPKGELARFKTGHYIPREEPEEFTRVLREFLAK